MGVVMRQDEENIAGEIVQKHIINVVPVLERVLLLKVNASPVPMNINEVYAPTADRSDEEVKKCYREMVDIYDRLSKHHLTIIMGDFNVNIGNGEEGEFVGPHGLEHVFNEDVCRRMKKDAGLLTTIINDRQHPDRMGTIRG
ncbi:hypothetical protein Trydic_g17203 [Trypoxylus dichotomus]